MKVQFITFRAPGQVCALIPATNHTRKRWHQLKQNTMKRFITFFILSISIFSISFGQTSINLKTKSLLDDHVEIMIPEDFKIMSEEMLKLKYPSANRPTIVYTNESGSINVALNLTTSSVSQELIPQFKEALQNTFKQLYPSAKWKGSGINTINDKKVGYLELITPAIDTEVYNLIFFTDVNSQLLLCTFNCTVQYLKEWQSIGDEIMNSLKVK